MSRTAGTERPIRHLVGTASRRSAAAAWRRVPFPLRAPTRPAALEPAERRTGVDYDTSWARRPAARAARRAWTEVVWRGAAAIYADPLVLGADRLSTLDPDGGVIFAANHRSHADTPLLLTSIPRPWRDRLFVAAAADYFFPNRVAASLSALGIGAVPIERTRISKRSVELPIELLGEGWCQIIYPEGGRAPDGWGQDFRPGVGLVARHAGVPVVPTYVAGTDRVLAPGASWLSRASTIVVFGHPLRHDDGDHRAFAARLRREVDVLADEVDTDWWTARRRAHAGTTPHTSGPEASSWRRAWTQSTDTTATPPRRPRSATPRWPRT